MKEPLEENAIDFSLISTNFKRTRNVPLDNDFLTASLDVIDLYINKNTRYPGQPFFSIEENSLYYFDKNLNYIKVSSYPMNVISIPLTEGIRDYSDLLTKMNEKLSSNLQFTYVIPMNVLFFYNGTNWKYFNGIYSVSSSDEWNTIDSSLAETGVLVNFSGNEKIVNSDKSLSDKIILVPELPNELEECRYYKTPDNTLYFVLMGYAFPISSVNSSQDLFVSNMNIHRNVYEDDFPSTESSNIVNHAKNSLNVDVFMKVTSSNPEISNRTLKPDFTTIDANNIEITSCVDLENCVVVVKTL